MCAIARPGGCRNWPLLIIVYATKFIACTSVGSFAQGLWNLSLFTAAHRRDRCADHFGFSNYGFVKFGSSGFRFSMVLSNLISYWQSRLAAVTKND